MTNLSYSDNQLHWTDNSIDCRFFVIRNVATLSRKRISPATYHKEGSILYPGIQSSRSVHYRAESGSLIGSQDIEINKTIMPSPRSPASRIRRDSRATRLAVARRPHKRNRIGHMLHTLVHNNIDNVSVPHEVTHEARV
jgi:hypothetical protein